MELDSFDLVRTGAADFLCQSKQLNVLVNNVDVTATPEGRTKNGFETQFGTNYLAHILLFQLLKPTFLAPSIPSFYSAVVSVLSIGHRSSPVRSDDSNFQKELYNLWTAYGQSKTANSYLTNEIERWYGADGLHATSLHPGGIATGLQVHVCKEQMTSWDSPVVKAGMKSLKQGAAASVYAVISNERSIKDGRCLSNCVEERLFHGGDFLTVGDDGYAPYAYHEQAEKRFWEDSLKAGAFGGN